MIKHEKLAFWLWAIALQIVLFFIVKNDPFFGDSISSTARAATYIFENQLLTVFYPPEIDPGHPTLYAWLMAACFTIFGKSLPVAHTFSCIWALIFLYGYIITIKNGHNPKTVYISGFFATLFATYLSQSAMMLNTLAVMSFFLFAINAIKKNKPLAIALFATCMCLTHLQGAFLLLSLAVYDLYLNRKNGIVKFIWLKWWVYGIPFTAFVLWLCLHNYYRGWYFISPNYSDANELNSPIVYLKALLTIVWRLVDFGMIMPYAFLAWCWFKIKPIRAMLIHWLVLLLPTALGMAVFLNNTIGHRYFLPFNLLALNITAVAIFAYTSKKKWLITIMVISLLIGNFIYYPGKNLGDGTLAYRGIFSVIKQIESSYTFNQTPYSHAPIANPSTVTQLQPHHFNINRINETPFDSIAVIIQSNVNAEFSVADQFMLREKWYGKTYQSGYVYAHVFLNPTYFKKPANWKLRELTWAEKTMLNLKKMAGK